MSRVLKRVVLGESVGSVIPQGGALLNETSATLRQVLKSTFKAGRFVNYGDMDYVEYGGTQVKYDPRRLSFEVYELHTPDSGYPGYLLESTEIDLNDIFEGFTDSDVGRPLDELTPTGQAMNVAQFTGSRWNPASSRETSVFITGILTGWIAYYGSGGSPDGTWLLSDYGIEDVYDPDQSDALEDLQKEIARRLKGLGLDL